MSYEEKFIYPTVIKESTTECGRVYFVEYDNVIHDPVYSVTTILSKTSKAKEDIQQWRNTIGHENADYITQKSINFGNVMHDILYHRIIETPDYPKLFKQNFIYSVAQRMADSIWKEGLCDVDEFWGAEVPVFVPGCYAGRTDLVAVYKGKPTIIDFKNAAKEKKEEHMEDYFVQSAAYAIAHDYLFDTQINQSLILIGNSSTGKAKKILKDGDDFKAYKSQWLSRLESIVT